MIVAHPDDETLWAGGLILRHPSWDWFVGCLCRRDDEDRSPKFIATLKALHAEGAMGDLDDGPEQEPLPEAAVEEAILGLWPARRFDLILSHNPTGEYTKHLRHQEVSQAVIKLWHDGRLTTKELRTFAYEDGSQSYYPRAEKLAPISDVLPSKIWKEKYRIMTGVYGFRDDSWEACTTPKTEAFWKFSTSEQALRWLENGGKK